MVIQSRNCSLSENFHLSPYDRTDYLLLYSVDHCMEYWIDHFVPGHLYLTRHFVPHSTDHGIQYLNGCLVEYWADRAVEYSDTHFVPDHLLKYLSDHLAQHLAGNFGQTWYTCSLAPETASIATAAMIVRPLADYVQKLTEHLTTVLGFEHQDHQTISFEKFHSSMDYLEAK